MSERRLDEAIDRAVREMMSVDPRPGLRRRVLGRIDAPQRAWLTVPRLAGAATMLVVAAVAAAWLVSRTSAPVSPRVSATDISLAAPRGPAGVPAAATDTRTRVRHRATAPVEIPPFAGNLHVSGLADIASIVVAPAGPRALDAPEVVVPPLAPIEPVRVDPLSSTPH